MFFFVVVVDVSCFLVVLLLVVASVLLLSRTTVCDRVLFIEKGQLRIRRNALLCVFFHKINDTEQQRTHNLEDTKTCCQRFNPCCPKHCELVDRVWMRLAEALKYFLILRNVSSFILFSFVKRSRTDY